MPDSDDVLGWLLFRQDDVISRRQALGVIPEARLRRLVASGRWTRPHRGVYVAHNGPLTAAQRAWVAALCAGAGRPAPLAGLSALAAHGLRGYETRQVHVYLPATMRYKAADAPPFLVVHRTRQLTRDDFHYPSPPRTTAARSVLDAAQWAPSGDRARAIIAAAFQQRLVEATDVSATLARMTWALRRDLITATLNDV
ncbi:MAG TPA: type IV toxin-antitoxin system AbiEi family antitoxin domain-containing protein, partial [Micromonosporaceae bacterium]|nr:type IV toxin-antitoxin system AbiEi family antitoxin domain-containing protein [Micromonosporaceae bacterium]